MGFQITDGYIRSFFYVGDGDRSTNTAVTAGDQKDLSLTAKINRSKQGSLE